jgi:hypothetical protein
MKITITPSGGKPFVLADDSSGATVADGFQPQQTRVVQNRPLFRAAYKANLPRYNLENRLQFEVERSFATKEAALNFMAQHADQVPVAGTLTLYNLLNTGQVSRSLANALVVDVRCVEHIGVSCKFQYLLAGNGAWQ